MIVRYSHKIKIKMIIVLEKNVEINLTNHMQMS